RVLHIGTRADVRRAAGASARRIDCHGAVLLPGLVDAHLHLFGLATRQAHLDCSDFRRVDDLLAVVRSCAAGSSGRDWIRGGGGDETLLGRLPTAAGLAAAVPRAPRPLTPPRR